MPHGVKLLLSMLSCLFAMALQICLRFLTLLCLLRPFKETFRFVNYPGNCEILHWLSYAVTLLCQMARSDPFWTDFWP